LSYDAFFIGALKIPNIGVALKSSPATIGRQNGENWSKSIGIFRAWFQLLLHHPIMWGHQRTTWKISKHKWKISINTHGKNRHETKRP